MDNIGHTQNFLKHNKVANKILDKSNIQEGDFVVDIGAGKGILTTALLNKVTETGKVVAIEKDKELAEDLRIEFSSIHNVNVLNIDFFEYNFPKKNFKVFANIPFMFTSRILERLLDPFGNMRTGYLILQKEAAETYISNTNTTLKALLVHPWFDITFFHRFSKSDFFPAPKVETTMIEIQKRKDVLVPLRIINFYRDFICYIRNDSFGSGSWKKLFTDKQIEKLESEYGFQLGKGFSKQNKDSVISAFNIFSKLVDVKKQSFVVGSYEKYQKEKGSIQKVYRTRVK